MKRVFTFALIAATLLVTLCAFGATPVTTHKKKATAKKTTAKKGSTTAASHKKGAPGKKAASTTWRNRQMAPSSERYHEIQDALVAKGYLNREDANGTWNQNSVDALKRFQSEQSLDASGKINSLSLIALGLGPKRETTASAAPPPKVPQ
jgi:peptidoglycan hydrolase-like protein with peptidoglycan-binding domain